MTIINSANSHHDGVPEKEPHSQKPMRDMTTLCHRKNKASGPQKMPSILALAIEQESPFMPSNVKEMGCSEQEYILGRERIATRQFMRLVANMIIKEQLLKISKEVPNEDM